MADRRELYFWFAMTTIIIISILDVNVNTNIGASCVVKQNVDDNIQVHAVGDSRYHLLHSSSTPRIWNIFTHIQLRNTRIIHPYMGDNKFLVVILSSQRVVTDLCSLKKALQGPSSFKPWIMPNFYEKFFILSSHNFHFEKKSLWHILSL